MKKPYRCGATTLPKTVTLEQFLTLPETEPASEFGNGQITQKPTPQGEHSLLQGKLCQAINRVTEGTKIALAFPELRCVFGGRAIVPDIAVFRWERIPRLPSGRIANPFEVPPDWVIEILSPEQKYSPVLSKLLACAEQGTELGWRIDPEDESIWTVEGDRRIASFTGENHPPVLTGVDLLLTVTEVFGWLGL
ncbi:MAG: Uma2 family endonuclease [Pseudanabaenaceae cyanobacterium]